MSKRYTKEELIEHLHRLEIKYGKEPNTRMIENDVGSPSRGAYESAFGSVHNALVEAGYHPPNYAFGKLAAQNKLRNAKLPYDILFFNGRRKHSILKCKRCGKLFEGSIASLYENNEFYKIGCQECHKDLANKRKIQDEGEYTDKHQYKLAQLLSDDLNTYYILGLLLSDGHFSKQGRIILSLSAKDRFHINKIAQYLKVEESVHCRKGSYCIVCQDSYTTNYLINKYKITSRKTYEPCDISSLDGDHLIAFLIGFIDGDGSIAFRSDTGAPKIVIKLHKSWEENLNYLSKTLYEIAGVENAPKAIDVVSKQGGTYTSIAFGNQIAIRYLKEFINKHQLIHLNRKWSRIK